MESCGQLQPGWMSCFRQIIHDGNFSYVGQTSCPAVGGNGRASAFVENYGVTRDVRPTNEVPPMYNPQRHNPIVDDGRRR